jgi:integrase/recombinase XerD
MLPGTSDMPANKGKRYPIDPPTDEEIGWLMDACPRTLIGARDRALIAFLRGSGLRISEAVSVRPDELDFEHANVIVRRGKGGAVGERSGVTRRTLDELTAWMLIRHAAGYGPEDPLFPTLNGSSRGEPMSTDNARKMLRNRRAYANITRRCNPHGLRHALASDMMRHRHPLTLVQRQLRHKSAATTARYVTVFADVELYEAVESL